MFIIIIVNECQSVWCFTVEKQLFQFIENMKLYLTSPIRSLFNYILFKINARCIN